jgi:hypothetical protein
MCLISLFFDSVETGAPVVAQSVEFRLPLGGLVLLLGIASALRLRAYQYLQVLVVQLQVPFKHCYAPPRCRQRHRQ